MMLQIIRMMVMILMMRMIMVMEKLVYLTGGNLAAGLETSTTMVIVEAHGYILILEVIIVLGIMTVLRIVIIYRMVTFKGW